MRALRTRAAGSAVALLLLATACGQVADLDDNVETASEPRELSTPADATATSDPVIARGQAGGVTTSGDTSTTSSATRGRSGEQIVEPSQQARSEASTSLIPAQPSATTTEPEPAATTTTTTVAETTTTAPTVDTTAVPTTEAAQQATTTEAPTTTQAPTTTEAAGDALADPTTTTEAPATTTTIAEAVSVPDPVPSAASGTAQVAMVAGQSINVYSDVTDTDADWTFGRATQFGNPTVFLIAGSSGNRLKILLPVRQKHTYGWIDQSDVTISTTDFRAVVDLSSRNVTVYSGANVISTSQAVIGKSSTPTPVGQFFVTDKLRHANPGGAYGPWILALSARSEALTSFNGGEPIVALHGTNKPWLVGGKHSNGCIRLPNDVITALAEVVPLGTPVDVVA